MRRSGRSSPSARTRRSRRSSGSTTTSGGTSARSPRPATRPTSGDAWQNRIFDVAAAAGLPNGRAFAAHLRRVPRAAERAPRRLAARVASIRSSSSTAPDRLRAGAGMSVGLQRLRDDAETVRRGAIDKGEDPTIVDRVLELDARRRTLLGDGDSLKAERNAASRQIGAAIKGGAKPDGPEVAELKAASVSAGRADRGDRRGARDGRDRDRRPPPAHPEPGRPGRARSAARTRSSPSGRGASCSRSSSRSRARSEPMRQRPEPPGVAGPTGTSPPTSTSSTSLAAPRSPAPASRSTRARAPGSSAA